MSVDSFGQARRIAGVELGISTEPWGYEDETAYRVYEASHESAVEIAGIEMPTEDAPWQRIDVPAVLVDKATGKVTREPVLSDLHRFNTMTRVGLGHPAELG